MQHVLTEEQLFCLEGCRSYPQYHSMRKGFEQGDCAFCTLNRELNKVLWGDEPHQKVWAWHVHPKFLRRELRYHGLIVPKRHVRYISDLTDDEVLEVHHAMQWMNTEFSYVGGLWHAREGDMRLNAGTVPHLHYNIFEPNGTGEVRVPIFKDTTDRAENQRRAEGFSLRYEAGEPPS